jgi:RNA polymerase sigma factor (sigma-70 family)
VDAVKAIGKTLVAAPERKQEADADLALVRQVQAGEVAAFDTLVRRYRERIFGVVYNLTSNREDAADLTQEAFIKAFRSIGRFKGDASFFTWLYRIAVNATVTHLRRNRLKRFFSFEKFREDGETTDLIERLASNTRAGDRETLGRELQERLNEAFQKLSIPHRTVVTLFEIDQLSHQEIADVMNCSVGTVRSRLHYAKLQLQADLQAYLG